MRGQGKFIDPHSVQVESEGKKETFRAEALVVATGSRPSSLPQIPFDGQRILSSDDIFLLTEPPKELIIIGGGVIGVEFAMIFNSLGTRVTLLEMLPQIISTEEPEVIQGLHRLFREGRNPHPHPGQSRSDLAAQWRGSGYFAEGGKGGKAFRREGFDGRGAETEYGVFGPG